MFNFKTKGNFGMMQRSARMSLMEAETNVVQGYRKITNEIKNLMKSTNFAIKKSSFVDTSNKNGGALVVSNWGFDGEDVTPEAEAKMKRILNDLSRKFGFVYSTQVEDENILINIEFKGGSISEAVDYDRNRVPVNDIKKPKPPLFKNIMGKIRPEVDFKVLDTKINGRWVGVESGPGYYNGWVYYPEMRGKAWQSVISSKNSEKETISALENYLKREAMNEAAGDTPDYRQINNEIRALMKSTKFSKRKTSFTDSSNRNNGTLVVSYWGFDGEDVEPDAQRALSKILKNIEAKHGVSTALQIEDENILITTRE